MQQLATLLLAFATPPSSINRGEAQLTSLLLAAPPAQTTRRNALKFATSVGAATPLLSHPLPASALFGLFEDGEIFAKYDENGEKVKDVKQRIVLLLRVKEACQQEIGLVNRGNSSELLRQDVKKAIVFIRDNYNVKDRINAVVAVADPSLQKEGKEIGETVYGTFNTIAKDIPADLRIDDLKPQQKEFIINSLEKAKTAIDSLLDNFIAPDIVAEARAQVQEENGLNMKEYKEAFGRDILNPTPGNTANMTTDKGTI
mmetsp:Transcript_9760/g.15626  ORF Transcript_9760/g.15626 Transcript_9760/m.15626 type:complete len:258 (-) Transcript_9760:184-957(-)